MKKLSEYLALFEQSGNIANFDAYKDIFVFPPNWTCNPEGGLQISCGGPAIACFPTYAGNLAKSILLVVDDTKGELWDFKSKEAHTNGTDHNTYVYNAGPRPHPVLKLVLTA